MKIEWRKLLEGVNNSIFIKEEVEKVAAARIAVCNECPRYSPNAKAAGEDITRKDAHCLECKCNMYLKTRAMSAFCPLHKWEALTDDNTATLLMDSEALKPELDNYKRALHAKTIDDHGN